MRMPPGDPVEVWHYPNQWFVIICGVLAVIILLMDFFPGAWGKLWKRK